MVKPLLPDDSAKEWLQSVSNDDFKLRSNKYLEDLIPELVRREAAVVEQLEQLLNYRDSISLEWVRAMDTLRVRRNQP